MRDSEYSIEIMREQLKSKYISPEILYAFKNSIEAMEKQVAEKPYYLQYCAANREVGNWNHGMACICKKYAKYCSNCGQKLD